MVVSVNFRTYMLAVGISVVALNGLSSGHGIKNAHVVESFFSKEDIAKVLENQKISSWSHDMTPKTKMVASYLSKQHVNRFLKAAGFMEEQEKGQTILIKTMTDTTIMHTDQAIRKEDGSLEVPVDKSAFVFLNSNPDASFVIEGDEESIPVREGDLVMFPGGQVRHQTIVESGVVQIAGPWTVGMDSKVAVGGRPELPDGFIECPTNFLEEIIFFILRLFGIVEGCFEPRRKLAEDWFLNDFYKEEAAAELEAEEAALLRNAKK